MEGASWIDALSRALAARASRKDVLRLLALAAAGRLVADAPPVEAACRPGLTRCGGRCVNLKKDEANCGRCGRGCGGGRATCCGGRCVDTGSDPQNCGRCGGICSEDQRCVNGDCTQCPDGKTLCGNVCKNLRTDDDNCGRCGRRCRENETCEAGNCKCPGPRCGPLQDICCQFAASSGGNCCPTNVKPKCCGGTHPVCQEDGCCPAGFYSCLDGQRCCPRGTICTGTDRCKNPSRSPDAAETTSAAAALRAGG